MRHKEWVVEAWLTILTAKVEAQGLFGGVKGLGVVQAQPGVEGESDLTFGQQETDVYRALPRLPPLPGVNKEPALRIPEI
jgi:hypothetical protein